MNSNMKIEIVKYLICFLILACVSLLHAQETKRYTNNQNNLPVKEYQLSIDKEKTNVAEKVVYGMTINGTIPGPELKFTEGEYAVIHVTNNMGVETSVHWHGLLLPNFYDGVPYLNTPPIAPGETFTYEFPLIQSGTYWYHSHTMLQEQSGVYGAFVIEPKEKAIEYDKDLVLVLSDWTNENPHSVLKNLKRGNEWYGWKKGTSTPLNKVIAQGGLGAQFNFWKQRMEGADIADVYYDTFLVNGKPIQNYETLKPGEKVRVRIINAAASTYFWLTFGGDIPLLISSDGIDVMPVKQEMILHGVAETYDFVFMIPERGKIELRATAQDGSGYSSVFLGAGDPLEATVIPSPDKIKMMTMMASMDMKMGAPAIKFRPSKPNPQKLMEKYGMSHDMNSMGNMEMNNDEPMEKQAKDMGNGQMNHTQGKEMDKNKGMKMKGMKEMKDLSMINMSEDFEYNYLKAKEKTNYGPYAPVNEILLNLTGNMNRYIWSLNGIPLSETDKIKIKRGEITRITFNNLTMMHHPMHLHGHFFLVLNEHGEYSPLKHTVNVAPMKKITIEILGNEQGDWIMHCHILYHMMGGMARIFSYGDERDERMNGFPIEKLIHETDQRYTWGTVTGMSQMSAVNITTSNLRNQYNLDVEYGYNGNVEAELTYERYLSDYVRIFGGINMENDKRNSLDTVNFTAVAGMRFLTPYLFNLDIRLDSKIRPRIGIGRELMIFPRTSIFGYYEYQFDFGAITELEQEQSFQGELVWSSGIQFMLTRNLRIAGSYDNRYGIGGGLSMLF
ncbi:MAG: CopA family copper-resistance protein [Saprospiraceae bacterium]|jgi:CopA family copper-resistance protein